MQQILLNAEGYLFVIDNRHPKFPTAIAAVSTLNPEYVNLLAASLLLYRTAQEATTFLEKMVEYLESKGLDEAVAHVTAISGTLNTAMQVAREGFPKKSSQA